MNEEFLTLLESEDAIDNITALSVFESNYDAMYEDSDPTDGVSDTEIEAIKRRKEKQKQIVKIIAICTAGIAACAAIVATVVKLKKKGEISDTDAERVTKKAEKDQNVLKRIMESVKNIGKEKGLTKSQSDKLDDYEKEASEISEHTDILRNAWSNFKVKVNSKRKDKKFEESAADLYDSMVDAILEKYNNDMIDAETCIALMERAAERYSENDCDINE